MKTAIALSGLIGLLLAQVGIKLPPEKLEKAYLYELVVEPLEETKIPPPPPSPERVREAFLKKWAFWSYPPLRKKKSKDRDGLYSYFPAPVMTISPSPLLRHRTPAPRLCSIPIRS